MKRFLSCVLTFVLIFSLVPSAFAVGNTPPYSLSYLEDIDGVEFKKYLDLKDVVTEDMVRTQRTLEVYDALERLLSSKAQWSDIVEPFREAFQDSGFTESINLDSNGQEQYWYSKNYDVFIILGEKDSHDILNEGGLIYIEHDYLTLPPSAMTGYQAADALYGMGLFSGTGTDANGNPIFDLDRAPTRQEAVTMLVRLLGKGKEAESGTWNTPFTDVADWAKPYVGYAYANGLTSGTSATTYGGEESVTASQYLTFVLCALGYSSGTDFQWDKAWELSDKLGITNGQYNASTINFTRGDVAVISYSSLFADEKPIDYSYLASSDFRSVRRNYPHAVAECGYAYEYIDLNGDQCVLTVVQYKIISQYSVITLHNLTKGTTITDPIEYYKDLIDRAYGQNKLNYYDLYEDFLQHYQTAMKAMLNVLQGGGNTASGSYVSAEYLNQ